MCLTYYDLLYRPPKHDHLLNATIEIWSITLKKDFWCWTNKIQQKNPDFSYLGSVTNVLRSYHRNIIQKVWITYVRLCIIKLSWNHIQILKQYVSMSVECYNNLTNIRTSDHNQWWLTVSFSSPPEKQPVVRFKLI